MGKKPKQKKYIKYPIEEELVEESPDEKNEIDKKKGKTIYKKPETKKYISKGGKTPDEESPEEIE